MNFDNSSTELSFINSTDNITYHNYNQVDLSIINSSININTFNNSTELSFILEEFYEGTLEYKIMLDFIMSYGGTF